MIREEFFKEFKEKLKEVDEIFNKTFAELKNITLQIFNEQKTIYPQLFVMETTNQKMYQFLINFENQKQKYDAFRAAAKILAKEKKIPLMTFFVSEAWTAKMENEEEAKRFFEEGKSVSDLPMDDRFEAIILNGHCIPTLKYKVWTYQFRRIQNEIKKIHEEEMEGYENDKKHGDQLFLTFLQEWSISFISSKEEK